MSQITSQLIKELREITGVGMAKCKEALEAVGGNIDKAIEHLRKAGMATAVKREGREANEGLIGIGEGPHAVSFVEINSETDFVAQNDKFKQFVKDIANEAAELQPKSVEEFLKEKCKLDASLTIDEYRALLVQSLGENIQIKRIKIILKKKEISIGVYSHMGGKLVTAVEMSGGEGHESLARDISMHIAAEAPEYLKAEDVPSEIKEREKDIARSQIKNKPEQVAEKIVAGKLQAFYDQFCLLDQKYVKDNSLTIAALLQNESKTAHKTFEIKHFMRWRIGE